MTDQAPDNPFLSGDMDDVLRMLDDKMVRTASGSYINVNDLKEVYGQVREARLANQERPRPKSFAAARTLAIKDPALQTTPPPVPAPALARVSGVMQKEG